MRHSPAVSVIYLMDCNLPDHLVRAAVSAEGCASLPYPCRHSHEDEQEFWRVLGGRPQYLKTADEGGTVLNLCYSYLCAEALNGPLETQPGKRWLLTDLQLQRLCAESNFEDRTREKYF